MDIIFKYGRNYVFPIGHVFWFGIFGNNRDPVDPGIKGGNMLRLSQ